MFKSRDIKENEHIQRTRNGPAIVARVIRFERPGPLQHSKSDEGFDGRAMILRGSLTQKGPDPVVT